MNMLKLNNMIKNFQNNIRAIYTALISYVGGQFKRRRENRLRAGEQIRGVLERFSSKNKEKQKIKENSMSEEMRKQINMFRDFFNKSKILEEISEQLNESYGYPNYKNKLLLLYEIGIQRTYIFKTMNFFLIINDNRGNIVIATKQPITNFNFKVYDTNNNFYEIKFDGIVEKIKVSKKFFYSKEELKQKMNEL